MYRIGQFSEINRITVKTLRHYDEIGLLKPSEVDAFTGYRLYSSSQLPVIQNIIALKQIGLSLTDIKMALDGGGNPEDIVARLETTRMQLEAELTDTKDRICKLSNFITTMKKEIDMDNKVVIKDLPEVTVASLRKVIANYNELFTLAPAMGEVMRKHKVTCAVPEYCFNIYHDGEYREADIDVEICEAVVSPGPDSDGVTYRKISAVPTAACIYHKGPYEKLGDSYRKIMGWISENGYAPTDLPRESYIDGIWNKESADDWLTEIQIPVTKK